MDLAAAASAILLAIALVAATANAAAGSATPDLLTWEEVSRRAHDSGAFTQGLVLTEDGRLFESTGQYGSSTLRELDPTDGRVLRSRALDDGYFGEGLALVGDELVQLTWRAGLALRWDLETFEEAGSHRYQGQGWGLCLDGSRLVMSDGSARLAFRDPHTFALLGSVEVSLDGEPLAELNELECVEGEVWANVWHSDVIVRIDPASGEVTGVLDLQGLLEPHPARADAEAVLNGIAWDQAAGTFLVTGKYWPQMVEIRVTDP